VGFFYKRDFINRLLSIKPSRKMCRKLYLTSQNLLICSNGIYNLATTPSIPRRFVDMLIDVIKFPPLDPPPTPNTNIEIKYWGKRSSMHKNFFNPSWVSINFVHLYCSLNFLKTIYCLLIDQKLIKVKYLITIFCWILKWIDITHTLWLLHWIVG
jgi:hypothetical protein